MLVSLFAVSQRHLDILELMPERMSENNPNEEQSVDQASSGLEEEEDMVPRKPSSTGVRLWDRVRSSLLRPKVKMLKVSNGQVCIG